MNKNEAKKRIEKLREQITDFRFRYHVLNDPEVTDDIYESLTRELRDLEKEFPEFYDPNSLVNRVAGKPLDKFTKVAHRVPMLSLNDIFSIDELKAWESRIKKLIPLDKNFNYFCELKYDGLAVSLIYENGKFISGSTRGDGKIGEDITENLKMIENIPLLLKDPFPKYIEVRGEAVMSKAVLERHNKKNTKEGKALFANTRNAAAGSLRQLDPEIAKARKLDFFAYDIAEVNGVKIKNHSDKHKLLRDIGFEMSNYEMVCSGLDGVIKFIAEVEKIRPNYPYGTDGVVVSVDNLDIQNNLGVVGKAPRYMAAYKYPAEKATTIVEDITVNVGRTGALTPIAKFRPTLVAGSTISKATLHNIDQIERLDVRVGDTVVIHKAGDVIPEVVEVLTKLRTGKEKKFTMPKKCPVCGGVVTRRDSISKSVAYYCTNPKCPAKNQRGMEHFVNAFEIYEVGPKILDRFKDEGLISDVADLFNLDNGDISGLDRFGEKSAENIITSIREHKKVPLWRFLYGLGILHVGEQTAQDIASHFGTLEKIEKASLEDLSDIENIGPVVAKSLFEFFRDKNNIELLRKLKASGVVALPAEKQKSGIFSGKTLVITGTLSTMSREGAKEKIKSQGGRVSSSVSVKTDFLIVGKDSGSKLKEAQKLGVKTLSEADFLKLF